MYLEKRKTCSLCIDTFGANIVLIVNFIVAVTAITIPSVSVLFDSLDQAAGSEALWKGGLDVDAW